MNTMRNKSESLSSRRHHPVEKTVNFKTVRRGLGDVHRMSRTRVRMAAARLPAWDVGRVSWNGYSLAWQSTRDDIEMLDQLPGQYSVWHTLPCNTYRAKLLMINRNGLGTGKR